MVSDLVAYSGVTWLTSGKMGTVDGDAEVSVWDDHWEQQVCGLEVVVL